MAGKHSDQDITSRIMAMTLPWTMQGTLTKADYDAIMEFCPCFQIGDINACKEAS